MVTVEREVEGAAVADDDLVAVVEPGAGGRGDDVVGADADALVRQELGDVVGEGVQGAGRAVDVEPYRLVVGDERGGAAGQEGDDESLGDEPPQGVGVPGERTAAALGGPPGSGAGGSLPGHRAGDADHRRGVGSTALDEDPVGHGQLLVERAGRGHRHRGWGRRRQCRTPSAARRPVTALRSTHAAPEDPPATTPSCAGTIAELR
ncbi:hypothetical protein SMICM17S_02548 [Streptomyces microflavus]